MKMIVRNFFAEFRILQLLPETFRGWIKFWSTQFTKWNQHSQSVAQVCCNQNVFKKLYFSKFLILQFFQISWLLKLYVKILKQQRFYERMQPPLSSRKGIFLRSFTFYNFCQNFSFQFLEGNCVTLRSFYKEIKVTDIFKKCEFCEIGSLQLFLEPWFSAIRRGLVKLTAT